MLGAGVLHCPLALGLASGDPPPIALASAWGFGSVALALVALLLLASSVFWTLERSRAARAGAPLNRLRPFLLNGAAAIPTITAWLAWLLGRIASLSPLDQWLVALAISWIAAPFVALGLTTAGEALTGPGRRPPAPPR